MRAPRVTVPFGLDLMHRIMMRGSRTTHYAARIWRNCGHQALSRLMRDARIISIGQIQARQRHSPHYKVLYLLCYSALRNAWCVHHPFRTTHHAACIAASSLFGRHFERTFA